MPAVPDFVATRGEWISLLLVALALLLAVRPVSDLLAIPRSEVGDLFWTAGLAFVVVGRLAYVALGSPEALTDPLLLVRIQGGIEPLAGLLGIGVVLAWRTWRDSTRRLTWLAAAAAGLAITVIVYDLGCVARDGCSGAAAPPPLGFALSGLSETRLATPLLEAALLLLVAGALFSSELGVRRSLIALAGLAAIAHAAFAPLSVRGTEAIGIETGLFAALGVAAIAVALRDRSPNLQT